MKRAAGLLVVLLFAVAYAAAPVENSQGVNKAPVSVGASPVIVIPGWRGRTEYTILPETVAIRCTFGPPDGSAPATAPTTTVGFLIPASSGLTNAPPTPQQAVEGQVLCISTGAATNVSTVEVRP